MSTCQVNVIKINAIAIYLLRDFMRRNVWHSKDQKRLLNLDLFKRIWENWGTYCGNRILKRKKMGPKLRKAK